MWQTLMELDASSLLWIQEYIRNDFLTPVMKFITHLGDQGKIWIALAVLCLFFTGTRKAGILTGISLLSSLLVNNMLLKNLVGRTRPYEVIAGLERIIEKQGGLSFPSGHTASSFAAAVVLYLMCPKKIGVPALVLAILIGVSRLYLGVHYPTDVIAGAVSGTLIAFVVCRTFRSVS